MEPGARVRVSLDCRSRSLRSQPAMLIRSWESEVEPRLIVARDPCDRSLLFGSEARGAPFWLLRIVSGCFWLLLVASGCLWLLLASSGLHQAASFNCSQHFNKKPYPICSTSVTPVLFARCLRLFLSASASMFFCSAARPRRHALEAHPGEQGRRSCISNPKPADQ